MKNLEGTPLDQESFEKVVKIEWKPKIEYEWDCGIAISKFLEGLKKGYILARKCNVCGRVLVPPRMFCELCFRPNDEWVTLSDEGEILTFSVCFVNWDATRREKPEIPAVIRLYGASPNIGILHKIGEAGDTLEEILKNIDIGTKVKAVWKKEEEREGAITDILYFKPIK
ncbi:MAG: Zn-ribbon domain-containing OB-fold protein [Candidatus Hydrothermales bacterium]